MEVEAIIESVGYLGIFLAVFIECGVPLGIILPLPGFSLLFTAGVFASNGSLSISWLITIGVAGAVLGYIVGYAVGRRYGRKLFYETNTKKYFTAEQGKRTEKFMNKFGLITLVVGRFMAIVSNIVPIMSGVAKTPLLTFMIANFFGAVIWTCSAVLGGYYMGQTVPNAELFIIPVIIAAFLIANTSNGRRWLHRISEKIEEL